MDGFLGGGDVGCDYQFGAWVVGVEGDWTSMNKDGQGTFVPYGPTTAAGVTPGIPFVAPVALPGGVVATGFNTANWLSAKERWLATARCERATRLTNGCSSPAAALRGPRLTQSSSAWPMGSPE